MLHRFRRWLEPQPPDPAPPAKTCDHPTCFENGSYRAPKSRQQVNSPRNEDWLWFCLEHVRKYNTAWNYYKDMPENEVEADTRANYTWQCPSWPLGQWSARVTTNQAPIFDPFDLVSEPQTVRPAPVPTLRGQEAQAVALFNIGYPFTAEQLRESYRSLAKKYHPDTNAGCPHSEEKLKKINEAYALLKTLL